MKYLEPAVTVLLLLHMKPYIDESLASAINQTRNDYHIVLVDSGQWIGKDDEVSQKIKSVYEEYSKHPRVEWYFTGEPPEVYKKVCPVAHFTNVAIDAGLIKGRYLCHHYDDDLYYPTFIEKMAGYLDEHPEAKAVYCTQTRGGIRPDGSQYTTGYIAAKEPLSGQVFDCMIDGQQFMMRTGVLKDIKNKYGSYYDESVDDCSHSDGVFLNRIASVIDSMHNLPDNLCEHRATPVSTYTPTIPKETL